MEVKDIYDNQAKRSFKSADVNTVIVVFNKPEADPLAHTVRFIAFKKPFEEVLSSDTLLAIEETKGIVSTDDFRVYQASQQDLLEEGFEKDKMQKKLGKAVPLTGKYKGNKWGGKYLRAPDIYFKIIEKAGDKLVRLGDIAEVRFGIKTGCNEFFYLDDEKIKEWGIEEEFLKPVIKSPRECRTIVIDPDVLPNKLFMCHKTKKQLKDTNALEYIKWGESKGFHKRPSTRSRPRWWSLNSSHTGKIAWAMIHAARHSVHYNPYAVELDHNFFEILSSPEQEDFIGLYAFSVFGILFKEMFGRQYGGGSGPIKTDGIDIQQLLFINPNCIGTDSLKAANQALKQIPMIHLYNVVDLLEAQPTYVIDSIVFDIIGLTKGERDAVYGAVVELVKNRLEKARSIQS